MFTFPCQKNEPALFEPDQLPALSAQLTQTGGQLSFAELRVKQARRTGTLGSGESGLVAVLPLVAYFFARL